MFFRRGTKKSRSSTAVYRQYRFQFRKNISSVHLPLRITIFQRGVKEERFAQLYRLGLGQLTDAQQRQAMRQRLESAESAAVEAAELRKTTSNSAHTDKAKLLAETSKLRDEIAALRAEAANQVQSGDRTVAAAAEAETLARQEAKSLRRRCQEFLP